MAILRKLTKAFTRILLKYPIGDRKSTRLNSSHDQISYAVFCLKKKKTQNRERGSQDNHITLQNNHHPDSPTRRQNGQLQAECQSDANNQATGTNGTEHRLQEHE